MEREASVCCERAIKDLRLARVAERSGAMVPEFGGGGFWGREWWELGLVLKKGLRLGLGIGAQDVNGGWLGCGDGEGFMELPSFCFTEFGKTTSNGAFLLRNLQLATLKRFEEVLEALDGGGILAVLLATVRNVSTAWKEEEAGRLVFLVFSNPFSMFLL